MRFWVGPLVYVLSLFPGVVLLLITILFLIGFVQALLSSQQLMRQFLGLGLMLGLLWYGYMHLPHFVSSALRKSGRSQGQRERTNAMATRESGFGGSRKQRGFAGLWPAFPRAAMPYPLPAPKCPGTPGIGSPESARAAALDSGSGLHDWLLAVDRKTKPDP